MYRGLLERECGERGECTGGRRGLAEKAKEGLSGLGREMKRSVIVGWLTAILKVSLKGPPFLLEAVVSETPFCGSKLKDES